MERALELAEKAALLGEVPVGCVVTRGDEIVGEGYNRRELDKNALSHAELIAINAACSKLGGWRLHQCELYVTLEPCTMCAGAIVNARIATVYFGASDKRFGACGSVLNVFEHQLNHKPEYLGGIYADKAAAMLQKFFKELRNRTC